MRVRVTGPVISFADWDSTRTTAHSVLREPLPDSVHLLALKTDVGKRWASAVLRLQHVYEVTAGNARSEPVTINPATLLASSYTVSEPLDLSGVVPVAAVPRMQWTPAADATPPWEIPMTQRRGIKDGDSKEQAAPVVLTPMQLVTYRLTFRVDGSV